MQKIRRNQVVHLVDQENRSPSSIKSLFLDVLLYVTIDVGKCVIIREMRFLKNSVSFLIPPINLRIQQTPSQVLRQCVANYPILVKILVEQMLMGIKFSFSTLQLVYSSNVLS